MGVRRGKEKDDGMKSTLEEEKQVKRMSV